MSPTLLVRGLAQALTGQWLTGPIFDKELRIASRRKITYIFRSLYLAAVIGLLALFWIEATRSLSYTRSAAAVISRMSEVGMMLTAIVAWTQFIAAQIAAGILLSTAISDEVNRRTLGVLLTAPITSLQIVGGKLLGALVQVMVLVGLSLPALAVVRVFGGVPWQFLSGAVCITLTTALFVGAMALFFSILFQRAYGTILLTLLTLIGLFLLAPLLIELFDPVPRATRQWLLFNLNPYVALAVLTEAMFMPGFAGRTSVSWPLHCGIILSLTLGLLLLCTAMVRRAARRQIIGAGHASRLGRSGTVVPRLRAIWGPPMVWKELHQRLLGRRPILTALILGVLALMVLGTYVHWALEEGFDDAEWHLFYGMLYMFIALLCTAVYAAAPVATEKEGRTWDGLLCTAMTDGQILWGKVCGVARRCLPVWSLLLGHVFIFVLLGYIHPVALVQIPFVVFWSWAIVTGVGLFFSVRLRRATTAVIVNVLFFGILWIGLPFLLAMMFNVLTPGPEEPAEFYMDMLPFVHLGATLDATARSAWNPSPSLSYEWIFWSADDVWSSSLWMLVVGGISTMVAYIFFSAARNRLRKSAG